MWNIRTLMPTYKDIYIFLHYNLSEWSPLLLATWFHLSKIFFSPSSVKLNSSCCVFKNVTQLYFDLFLHSILYLFMYSSFSQQALMKPVVQAKHIMLHGHSVAIWKTDCGLLLFLFIVLPSACPSSCLLTLAYRVGWLCEGTSHLFLTTQAQLSDCMPCFCDGLNYHLGRA